MADQLTGRDSRELSRAEVASLGLDRRRKYARIGSELCQLATWTHGCSGCVAQDGSYFGCRECGYTGKRRTSMWLPLEVK